MRKILHFFKKLFLKDKFIIEARYFEKYKNQINQKSVLKILEEYKSGDVIFEPIRNQITGKDQEDLYKQIDESNALSPQEKIETIIGLMMILDGLFPKPSTTSRLKKVFGKEFLKAIQEKQKEFKKEISVKKLREFVSSKDQISKGKLRLYEKIIQKGKGLVLAEAIQKIINDYGRILEKESVKKSANLLLPESKLPIPKHQIDEVLKYAIKITKNKKVKNLLKNSLIALYDFVPDNEVPDDKNENLKAWARRQKETLEEQKRILKL